MISCFSVICLSQPKYQFIYLSNHSLIHVIVILRTFVPFKVAPGTDLAGYPVTGKRKQEDTTILISYANLRTGEILPAGMSKENSNGESSRQREHRLEQLIAQGQRPCTNDLRFLLLRRASRLDTEDLRIVVTRIRELAAQEMADRQTNGGLQQRNNQNNP